MNLNIESPRCDLIDGTYHASAYYRSAKPGFVGYLEMVSAGGETEEAKP